MPRHRQVIDDPCPDDETLAAYVDHRLAPEESRRLQRHLFRCELCWMIVHDIEAIQREERHSDGE